MIFSQILHFLFDKKSWIFFHQKTFLLNQYFFIIVVNRHQLKYVLVKKLWLFWLVSLFFLSSFYSFVLPWSDWKYPQVIKELLIFFVSFDTWFLTFISNDSKNMVPSKLQDDVHSFVWKFHFFSVLSLFILFISSIFLSFVTAS